MKKDFNKKGGPERGERKSGSGERKNSGYGKRSEAGSGERKERDFSDKGKRGTGGKWKGGDGESRSHSDKDKRSYSDRDGKPGYKKSFGDKDKRSFDKKKSYGDRDGKPGFRKSFDDKDKRSFGKKDFTKRDDSKPPKKKTFSDVMDAAYRERHERPENEYLEKKDKQPKKQEEPQKEREPKEKKAYPKKTRQTSFDRSVGNIRTSRGTDVDAYIEKKLKKADTKGKKRRDTEDEDEVETSDIMPVNKYIAHSGECSRREAAELVKQGKVKVNGELVTDPGHKVTKADSVTVAGKKMKLQTDLVYILLNKPKGYITTTDDPEGRRTVMDLVSNSGAERVFPVGRLDRNTTGLLLLTNDGALAQKLSHPSHSMKKVYQATLDKPLTKAHFDQIAAGVELEDGKAPVDEIAYLDKKNEIGLEIHIGRNRVVRRIFEHLGYQVEKLDRMMYAGLTKKNLPRGKWRFLNEKEVILLKHFKS